MKLVKINKAAVRYDHTKDLTGKYEYDKDEFKNAKLIGKMKSAKNNYKILSQPMSMAKLIEMADMDEYHEGCLDAIAESCFIRFKHSNPEVMKFIEDIQLPGNDDIISIFSDFVFYYACCGNGILLKLRNASGHWVGLDRLIPSEVQIAENYDDHGFLRPIYFHVKAGKKKEIPASDIIHMIQKTSKSSVWGLACKSIVLNVEILNEIKNYDYNQFKNGLLIDYFMLVEGGTFGEKRIEFDESGNEIEIDPMDDLELTLSAAKGTKSSNSMIVLETADSNSKIRLEPMRKNDNTFKDLKKDLRDGILVHHRVPHRLVSQETAGKLGGDNNSDMTIFYNMVVKPIQKRIAFILAKEFKQEFNWSVKADDFDFGDISAVLETIETKLTAK